MIRASKSIGRGVENEWSGSRNDPACAWKRDNPGWNYRTKAEGCGVQILRQA